MGTSNAAIFRGRANTTYTVTRHGIDDLLCFATHTDKREFLNRIEQRLDSKIHRDPRGRPIKNFSNQLELLSVNVLDNHPHFVAHQLVADGIERFMRSLLTSYAIYFNQKHGRRSAPVFQGKNHLTEVKDIRQLKWAIGYVHLNDEVRQLRYPYSSHKYYMGEARCDWVNVDKALRVFGGRENYVEYMRTHGPSILANKQRRSAASAATAPKLRIPRGPGSHKAPPAPIPKPKLIW